MTTTVSKEGKGDSFAVNLIGSSSLNAGYMKLTQNSWWRSRHDGGSSVPPIGYVFLLSCHIITNHLAYRYHQGSDAGRMVKERNEQIRETVE